MDQGGMRLRLALMDINVSIKKLARQREIYRKKASTAEKRAEQCFLKKDIVGAMDQAQAWKLANRHVESFNEMLAELQHSKDQTTMAQENRNVHHLIREAGIKAERHTKMISKIAPITQTLDQQLDTTLGNFVQRDASVATAASPEIISDDAQHDPEILDFLQRIADKTRIFTPLLLPSVPQYDRGQSSSSSSSSPAPAPAPLPLLPSVPMSSNEMIVSGTIKQADADLIDEISIRLLKLKST